MTDSRTLGQRVPKEGLFLMDGIEGLRSLPKHSVEMLDAPVSGGEPKAIDGTLSFHSAPLTRCWAHPTSPCYAMSGFGTRRAERAFSMQTGLH